MNPRILPLLATAAALALPAAASADTLVAPAPGAQHLVSGGGYLVWATPALGGGYLLTVRAPDGTTTTPQIDRFRVAPRASIGSDRFGIDGRRLLALYSRDGDIFALDLRSGEEEQVRGASSSAYEETAPSMQYGRLTFVRRGGRDNGLFYRTEDGLRKISGARPRETAQNGSRVAYPSGRNVVIRRLSGRGRPAVVRTPQLAFSVNLSRYSATWLVRGGRVFQTNRFGGSSDVERASEAREAERTLPTSTKSIATDGSFVRYYLDAEGVKRISGDIFDR